MKKLLNIIMIFLFATVSFAQIDYSSTDGLYGDQLQKALTHLIRNHVKFPYSSGNTDTWDVLKEADKDPNNSANIITIYMGYSLDAEGEYSAGWNREHVWAKSHGFPSSGDTAYTDCHNLHACDASTNSARGNKDFDNGGQQYFDGGTVPSDCYYTSISWEPRDEVKGDVARTMFYMATRYNSDALNLQLVENIPTSSNTPYFGKLSTLLAWNRYDPPDDWERRRNNAVASFQHNRNPFIDHPEFADRIYVTDSLIIEYAETIAPKTFIVKFSEDLDQSTAGDISNYSLIFSDLQITSATVGYNGDNSIVRLITNTNFVDSIYIVRVNGVLGSDGKHITKDAIASFINNPDVAVEENNLPHEFSLSQNYPNPFNPVTTIKFSVPQTSKIKIVVFDVLGRIVKTLVNKEYGQGIYSVKFDASQLNSGVYFYSLTTANFIQTKKMILLK